MGESSRTGDRRHGLWHSVALALLYHLLFLHAESVFWLYFLFDIPFLIVYYALFYYHDIAPYLAKRAMQRSKA
ncbi:MAG: hypothetical protein ABI406_01525 [Ktedonobacteraceae bacterium]